MLIFPFCLIVAAAIGYVHATPPQTCSCQNAAPAPSSGFSGFPGFQQPQGFAQPQGFQAQPQPQFQGFATPGPSFSSGSCPPPIQFNCPPPPACPAQMPCHPTHTPHPFFATHPLFTTTFGPTVGPTLGQYNQNHNEIQNPQTDCGGVTPAPGSYNNVDQQTAAPNFQQPQPLQPLPESPGANYGQQQGQYYQQGGQQPLPVAEQSQAQVQPPQQLPQQGQYENQGQQYQGQVPQQGQVPEGQQQQQYQGQEGQQQQGQQQQGQYQEGQGQAQGQNQEQGVEQFPDGNRGAEMNIHVYREGENTNADYVETDEHQNKPRKEGANMDYETNTATRTPRNRRSRNDVHEGRIQDEVYRHRQKQLGAPTIDVIDETKCNNEKLRKIMLEATDDNPSTSKRKIQKEAMEKIGGIFDVVCSNGDFSYLANTRLYCETRVKDTICFAFLHNALP